MKRKPIYTHTGIVSSKDEDRKVRLYSTILSWVVSQKEVYHKDTGLRTGGPSRWRLNLSSIKEIKV